MLRLRHPELTGRQKMLETEHNHEILSNVVVSALLNLSSIPGLILQEALAGRVIPLLHEDILDEYNDVLHRSKFKFDRRDIEIALTGLIK